MTRIGTVDQVLLLLREQLQRAGRARPGARGEAPARLDRAAGRPLERVRALAALDALDPEEVRHAVVRGLLTEEFGDGIGNDAALQTMVDRVVRTIDETPGGRELIDRAVAELKGTA
ncbi:MAG: hypothetical protein WDN24_15270 [Sphingomonas sp.]